MRAELFSGILGADTNRLKVELGLPPVDNWCSWLEYGKPSIALWPDWFAMPDSTWPAGVVPVGFVVDNEEETDDVPGEVQAILDGGEPPILITPGTGTYLGVEFATVCAAACERLNRRGILVIRHDKQVPESLPNSVKRFSCLPFGKLMPHMAVVIHHGGRDTLSCAIAAGTPQLVLALGADRPDNASRLQRLGVAEYLAPHAWRPGAVAEKLRQLISSAAVRNRFREIADRAKNMDPLTAACKLIEDFIQTNKVSDASEARIE